MRFSSLGCWACALQSPREPARYSPGGPASPARSQPGTDSMITKSMEYSMIHRAFKPLTWAYAGEILLEPGGMCVDVRYSTSVCIVTLTFP